MRQFFFSFSRVLQSSSLRSTMASDPHFGRCLKIFLDGPLIFRSLSFIVASCFLCSWDIPLEGVSGDPFFPLSPIPPNDIRPSAEDGRMDFFQLCSRLRRSLLLFCVPSPCAISRLVCCRLFSSPFFFTQAVLARNYPLPLLSFFNFSFITLKLLFFVALRCCVSPTSSFFLWLRTSTNRRTLSDGLSRPFPFP